MTAPNNDNPEDPNSGKPSVVIKKYANRRLYNTETSSYVTLDHLAAMVKEGTNFNVYDAKTGEDLTHSILTQIIVEEESKDGQNLLPINFLRQLIGFYGKNMQWLVPKYLDTSMQSLTENQEKFRSYMQNAFGGMFPFGGIEEISKQNMAMFEKTMQMFTPFSEGAKQAQQMMQSTAEQQMHLLQTQLTNLQRQMTELSNKTK
ncbi:MAG: polyhydroxyalkanoate synthesis repressor PhaR [Alphaproteobacteria bacterium]